MNDEILTSLLKEYENKKTKAELDLEKRKELLYKSIPEFEKIDNEINTLTISTAKNILINNNPSYLLELNKKLNELKIKKQQLLKNNGYNEFYLKPFYECLKCNDTGYIRLNNNRTVMCSCLKQKILDLSFNKSNISNLKKENFNTFDENIYSDDVDLAKYKFNLSPRKNIINIKNQCIKFIENFDNPEEKNLIFSGSTGLR